MSLPQTTEQSIYLTEYLSISHPFATYQISKPNPKSSLEVAIKLPAPA